MRHDNFGSWELAPVFEVRDNDGMTGLEPALWYQLMAECNRRIFSSVSIYLVKLPNQPSFLNEPDHTAQKYVWEAKKYYMCTKVKDLKDMFSKGSRIDFVLEW